MDLQDNEVYSVDGWSDVQADFPNVDENCSDTAASWSVVSSIGVADWDTFSSTSSHPEALHSSYRDALLKTSVAPHQLADGGLPPTFKLVTTRRLPANEKQSSSRTERISDLSDAYDESIIAVKPYGDKLIKKYEGIGSRRNLHGHTGRRNQDEFNSSQYCFTQRNPVLEGGSDDSLTSIELNRGRSKALGNRREWVMSLNKSRGWEELPAILEAECIGKPKTSKEFTKSDGHRSVTTFQLKPKIKINDISKKSSEREDRLIYHKPPRAPSIYSTKFVPRKVFAEIDTSPPDFVKGSPLAWRVHNHKRGKKGTPVIHSECCWDVQEDCLHTPGGWDRRPFLEVDLGHSAEITAISTQGAPPPIRKYPSVEKHSSDLGFYRVEGHQQKGKYDGPYWWVLDPSWFKRPDKYGRLVEPELRWVRSYELWWRADRGRNWNSLGVFRGNDDTTTERAHLLTGFQSGSLRCRYLRVVPLDCENGGALRLGIYGEVATSSHLSGIRRDSRQGPEPDEDVLVEYKLHEPSGQKASGTLQRDVFAWGSYDYYWRERRPTRGQRKVEANRLCI